MIAALTVMVMAYKSVRSAEKTLKLFASVAELKHVSSAFVLHAVLPVYDGVEITWIVCVKVAVLNPVSI